MKFEVYKNATIFPQTKSQTACGVVDEEGNFVMSSRTSILPNHYYPPPEFQDLPDEIDLRSVVYAGWLRGHFGHFLSESIGRLWYAQQNPKSFDAVAIFSFKGGNWRPTYPRYRKFISMMSGNAPITRVLQPTRFKEVIVPELGFGHYPLHNGLDEFNHFMKTQIGTQISAKGAEKIYISRSQLPVARGTILCEHMLDEIFASNGFEVFHPQRHSLEEQIAQYRAAKEIVALDGSALHFAAFFIEETTRLAVISRREHFSRNMIISQLRNTGASVFDIRAIEEIWQPAGLDLIRYDALTAVDFPSIVTQLIALDFIRPGQYAFPSQDDIQACLARYSEGRNASLVRFDLG